jgi:tetratricopeptide (TPR) repeat protein
MRKGLLILILSVAFIPAHSQKINDLLKISLDLAGREKYDSAMLYIKKAWAVDSMNHNVRLYRGRVYYGMKEWTKSFEDYTWVTEHFPDSADAYHDRGILFLTTMNTEEAIADNTKAVELARDDTMRFNCFLNRGTCYQQKREFQSAYEDYSRAYLIDSAATSVLNNLATVLDELGRREESIEILKKITRIEPDFVGAYVNLGFQYTKLGKYKEAIDFFNKALELEKDEPLALNNRGYAKYSMKDYKGALADINKSLSIYPENSYALRNRALVYIATGDKAKACLDIVAGIELGFTQMYGNELSDLKKTHCK